ncbi:MAG: CapA family protein [Caldicoprobacterales bacterium]|jgi:poly-gamma-glutamate capsule biosynthesis protein CapA/YwtB (metallophosphatase superfamily)|nr:CapA family protein [Clostridiales bacterium]
MKRFRIHIILILCLLLFYAIIAGDSLLKRFSAGPGEEGIVQEQGTEDNNDTVEGEQPQADLEDPQDESDDPLSELEEPEEEQEPRGTTSLKISVVGDIMVHNHQLKAAREPDGTYNFTEVFEDIRPYLEEADIVMGNLETTISTDEKGYTAYPRFRSPISLITALKGAGFDVLTTANNHTLDALEFGVEHTLDVLDEHRILHTGSARSPEERDRILIVEENDIKVAILAYTYGTNGMEGSVNKDKLTYMVNYLRDTSRIEEDVRRAKEEGAEFIVVCAHWGDEYVRTPNEGQKSMAKKFFDMGVDAIFGSHPHVIQPMERKIITTPEGDEKETFVIYSLGNIVSNQRDRYRDSGLILNLEVIKDYDNGTISIGEIDYIPTWVYRFTKDDRLHYRILPVKDFLDADLGGADSKRIKEVWKETTEHLETEGVKVRD